MIVYIFIMFVLILLIVVFNKKKKKELPKACIHTMTDCEECLSQNGCTLKNKNVLTERWRR